MRGLSVSPPPTAPDTAATAHTPVQPTSVTPPAATPKIVSAQPTGKPEKDAEETAHPGLRLVTQPVQLGQAPPASSAGTREPTTVTLQEQIDTTIAELQKLLPNTKKADSLLEDLKAIRREIDGKQVTKDEIRLIDRTIAKVNQLMSGEPVSAEVGFRPEQFAALGPHDLRYQAPDHGFAFQAQPPSHAPGATPEGIGEQIVGTVDPVSDLAGGAPAQAPPDFRPQQTMPEGDTSAVLGSAVLGQAAADTYLAHQQYARAVVAAEQQASIATLEALVIRTAAITESHAQAAAVQELTGALADLGLLNSPDAWRVVDASGRVDSSKLPKQARLLYLSLREPPERWRLPEATFVKPDPPAAPQPPVTAADRVDRYYQRTRFPVNRAFASPVPTGHPAAVVPVGPDPLDTAAALTAADPARLGPVDLHALRRARSLVQDQLDQARHTPAGTGDREQRLAELVAELDAQVDRVRNRLGLPQRLQEAPSPIVTERRPAPLARGQSVPVDRLVEVTALRDAAQADLVELHGKISIAERELAEATAANQLVDEITDHIRELRERATEAFARLRELDRQVSDLRRRMGLPAQVRDMRFTGDPGAARWALLRRVVAHRAEQRGERAPLGRGFAGTPPAPDVGASLLSPRAQVVWEGKAKIPFMKRVKRVATLGRSLGDALREGIILPLVPGELRTRIDAAMNEASPERYDPEQLARRVAQVQKSLRRDPAYRGLDSGMRDYLDGRIADLVGKPSARQPLADTSEQNLWGWVRRHLLDPSRIPSSAVSSREDGRLGLRLVRLPGEGLYLEFRRETHAITYEESKLQLVRLTVADVKAAVPIVGSHTGVQLGGVASAGAKYAYTPDGQEHKQPVNRGALFAIKLSGSGPLVIFHQWHHLATPVRADGTVEKIKVAGVDTKVKHTLKANASVSPALFVPGLKLTAPVGAAVSVELSWTKKGDKPWQPRVEFTLEFVLSVKHLTDLLGTSLEGFYSPQEFGVPEWMPLEPDISGEAAFIIGPVPVDITKLSGCAVVTVREILRREGFTLPPAGLPPPEDLIQQLPEPPGPDPEDPMPDRV
jgi:hypothetical protein